MAVGIGPGRLDRDAVLAQKIDNCSAERFALFDRNEKNVVTAIGVMSS